MSLYTTLERFIEMFAPVLVNNAFIKEPRD